MTNLTPKQIAWNAFKVQDRKDRRALNGLRYFFVPKRLRARCVAVRQDGWWKVITPAPIARVLRGRTSNPTVLG